MKSLIKLVFSVLCISHILLMSGCERVIDLELPPPKEALVVYGLIETDSLVKVSLTRNSPYFDPVDLQTVLGLQVSDAFIVVEGDGEGEIDTLLPALEFQHYTPFNYKGSRIRGRAGGRYRIKIITTEHELEAETVILPPLNVDSIWHRTKSELIVEAGNLLPTKRDSELASVYYRYSDGPLVGDRVRIFSRRNQESQWSSGFASAFSDELINGQTIDFILPRGKEVYLFNDSTTFNEFGFFEVGDTVYVKVSSIDLAQYQFWNTLASATGGSGNPFAIPTVVATNIRSKRGKGLGVWGGYGNQHYTYLIR